MKVEEKAPAGAGGGAAIAVAVVEDEARFRDGLAALVGGTPGLRCAGTYANGAAALAGLPAAPAEVVLLDINLPKMSGIECLRRLKPALPETQFVMLTAYQDDERIFESLAAGASGYLLKRSTPAEIVEAVLDVHRGGSPMTSTIARRVVQSFAAPPGGPGGPAAAGAGAGGGGTGGAGGGKVALSPREEEIVRLLARGFLYKEISAELGISLDTVRTHLRRVYEKLQVHTRTEAVVRFLGRG